MQEHHSINFYKHHQISGRYSLDIRQIFFIYQVDIHYISGRYSLDIRQIFIRSQVDIHQISGRYSLYFRQIFIRSQVDIHQISGRYSSDLIQIFIRSHLDIHQISDRNTTFSDELRRDIQPRPLFKKVRQNSSKNSWKIVACQPSASHQYLQVYVTIFITEFNKFILYLDKGEEGKRFLINLPAFWKIQ